MLKVEGGLNMGKIKQFFARMYLPIKIGIYVLAVLSLIISITKDNQESFIISIVLVIGAEIFGRFFKNN